MKELLKPFIEKATSGKFLFTIVAALVFAVLAIKGIMPVDKVHDVILVIIYAYFTKKPEGGQQ